MARRPFPVVLRRSLLAVGAGLIVAASGCADRDPSADTVVGRGQALYNQSCIQCHGGATGGSMLDVPPRHNAAGHTWHHADCTLEGIVLEGMPRRAGAPEMPAFGDQLSHEDVAAILAFIKTWWEPDQLEFQAKVTEQVC